MRRSFAATDVHGLAPHDHVLWCGDGPGAFDEVAVAAFTGAAARGELSYLVSDDPTPGRLDALDDLDGKLGRGELVLISIEETYRHLADPTTQQALFEAELDRALTAGYSGVCVVADNSPLATGTEEVFAAWLAWEPFADRMQASRPVTGVCYVDRRVVPDERQRDLAVLHPVASVDVASPSYRLYFDEDTVQVAGEIDFWAADRLHQVLAPQPIATSLVLDLSDLEFIDHQALMALHRLADEGHTLSLRGAKPIVRRLWDVLELSHPRVVFS